MQWEKWVSWPAVLRDVVSLCSGGWGRASGFWQHSTKGGRHQTKPGMGARSQILRVLAFLDVPAGLGSLVEGALQCYVYSGSRCLLTVCHKGLRT